MLKYFDDFIGKDLGAVVFGKLMFYFSLNMLQVALPLGVLVSSLMTFGNLGEHFELTAIKSAGISLTRAMKPIFVFVVFLSVGAFFFHDKVVPASNLKAYSLLYDIKHKKPTLDIKPGVFYQGIPNYAIKAGRKLNDSETLLDVMIYDHSKKNGNKSVILADSSRMYTIFNDKYLKLELYRGVSYREEDRERGRPADFYRSSFDRLDMVFSLSSFDLKRTKEELFQNNRQMKNIAELSRDIDSLSTKKRMTILNAVGTGRSIMPNHFKHLEFEVPVDTAIRNDTTTTLQASMFPFDFMQLSIPSRVEPDTSKVKRVESGYSREVFRSMKLATSDSPNQISLDTMTLALLDSFFVRKTAKKIQLVQNALQNARNFKTNITGVSLRVQNMTNTINKYTVSKYNKYAQAFACIVMFLIGAPLGAIIKKGGLGVPVLVSIFFFIAYYVLTMTSEKWAKNGWVDGTYAVWVSDLVLLPFGLFFLRQARIDARLFDWDFYHVVASNFKAKFLTKRS